MDISICVTGGIAPLQLPIANNPVSISGLGNTKGIGLTIGQPNQFFSMRPGVNQNNTFVVNAAYCGNAQNYSCIAENGGVYNPPANVLTTNNYASWNGTPGDPVKGFTNVYFNDKIQIGGKDVWGVPFFSYTKDQTGFSQPSCLALGINSSFLDAAVANQVTGTKQWSLWPGNTYNSLDGQLILGGYDADRAGSAFTEMPVLENTPLYVEITGLAWEFAPGNATNLMPNNTARLKGTLEPFFDYLTIPGESNRIFHNALNASYNSTIGYSYPTMPKGNLVVTLSNGQKTIIPATDLFERPNNYSDRGYIQTTSTRYWQAKMYTDENYPDGMLWIGQPFLTQKVVVSDFDKGKYYIADAVKQDLGKTASNLQPLCTGGPPGTRIDTKDNGTAIAAKNGGSKTNVGAIAGGVVGGVAALILVALALWFFRRHTKKSRQAAHEPSNPPEVVEPYRGSMVSPPPKYMQAGVVGYSDQPQHQYGQYQQEQFRDVHGQPRDSQFGHQQYGQPTGQYPASDPRVSGYGSELAAGAPLSPRSDGGFSVSQGTNERYSQVGTHALGSDSHEMSSENKFSATSGPIEMPAAEYRH